MPDLSRLWLRHSTFRRRGKTLRPLLARSCRVAAWHSDDTIGSSLPITGNRNRIHHALFANLQSHSAQGIFASETVSHVRYTKRRAPLTRLAFATKITRKKLTAGIETLEKFVPLSRFREHAIGAAQGCLDFIPRGGADTASNLLGQKGKAAAGYWRAWQGTARNVAPSHPRRMTHVPVALFDQHQQQDAQPHCGSSDQRHAQLRL